MLFFLSRASLQYDDRLPLQENHTLRSGQHRLGGSMPFPFFLELLCGAVRPVVYAAEARGQQQRASSTDGGRRHVD